MRTYTIEQLEASCEQFLTDLPSQINTPGRSALPHHATSALGLGIGKLTDGREEYMRNTVLACLREYIGTNGAAPTTQELFDAVWPQYEQNVAIEVPGKLTRGAEAVFIKCGSTLQRFNRGGISTMPSLDAAVETHKKIQEAQQPPVQQPAPQLAANDNSWPGFTAWVETDPRSIPHRRWLYGKHYIRQFVSCTIAPGGVGKSSLTMVEALAMATGRPLLGDTPRERARVMIWNGEDPYEELQRRIVAICLRYNIDQRELVGWLYIDSGRDLELIIASSDKHGNAVIDNVLMQRLTAELQAKKIDVLIIDPLVSAHRSDENTQKGLQPILEAFSKLAQECNISVELVHHTRKANGEEITADHARGSGALQGKVRSLRTVNPMTQAEAANLGIEENRRLFFRLDDGKANMAPPADKSSWYRLRSTDLGNGPLGMTQLSDQVGVVELWHKPDPFEGVNEAQVNTALASLRRGNWLYIVKGPSAHAADSRWAGKAIGDAFGIDISTISGRAKVKAWLERAIRQKTLTVLPMRDPETRREMKFIEVVDRDLDDAA